MSAQTGNPKLLGRSRVEAVRSQSWRLLFDWIPNCGSRAGIKVANPSSTFPTRMRVVELSRLPT